MKYLTKLTLPTLLLLVVSYAQAVSYHPADTSANWEVGDTEILSYLASWRAGNVTDAYVLNGLAMWKAGAYHYNSTQTCPGCWVVGAGTSGTWSKTFGGLGDDRGLATAVDSSGNVAVTGYFSGTVNFGGVSFTSQVISGLDPNNYKDIFIAKYLPTGTHLWSRQLGADADDIARGIATDGAGNVIVTGGVENYVDFGDGVVTGTQGGYDFFVAKYAALDGHLLWKKRYGSGGTEQGNAVTVDGNGDVVVVGTFQGTVNFGGANLTATGGSTDQDIFIAKYAGVTGEHIWSKHFGAGPSYDYANAVTIDSGNNILVTGKFYGIANFGGSDLVSAGDYDAFVAKYLPGGAHIWSKRFGGTLADNGTSIAVDSLGNVVAGGTFRGTVNFGGVSLASAGGDDVYLLKYLSDGMTHFWSQRLGSVGTDVANGIKVDSAGNILTTGSFQGTVDFDNNSVTNNSLTSLGGTDIFMAKYNSSGVYQSAKRYGGTGQDIGSSVALSPIDSSTLLTGSFQNTVDFGAGNVTSIGGFDAFLLKLNP